MIRKIPKGSNLYKLGYRIIGLSGKAGSGKDTIASILVKDYGFSRLGFADYLKFLTRKYLGVSDEEIKQKDIKTRITLQGLGMFMREQVHPDFWIKHMQNQILLKSSPKFIVISDVRFMNEIQWVKQNQGKMILIERDLIKEIEMNGVTSNHPSEIEWGNFKGWDFIIENKTVGETEIKTSLLDKVDPIIKNLKDQNFFSKII